MHHADKQTLGGRDAVVERTWKYLQRVCVLHMHGLKIVCNGYMNMFNLRGASVIPC